MISDELYADSLAKMAELKEKDAVQLHQEDANMKGKITQGLHHYTPTTGSRIYKNYDKSYKWL